MKTYISLHNHVMAFFLWHLQMQTSSVSDVLHPTERLSLPTQSQVSSSGTAVRLLSGD